MSYSINTQEDERKGGQHPVLQAEYSFETLTLSSILYTLSCSITPQKRKALHSVLLKLKNESKENGKSKLNHQNISTV